MIYLYQGNSTKKGVSLMSKKYKKKSYKLAKLIIEAVFAAAALITAVAKLIATLESVLR